MPSGPKTPRRAESASSISPRSDLTEFDFLEKLQHRAQKHRPLPSLVKGIGDDAAIIHQNNKTDLVISADLLVENIDFRRTWTKPAFVGHKALAVSLSDVAAMGAIPRYAMVSIGLPRARWEDRWLDEFNQGWFRLADRFKVSLIGGDISRTPKEIVIDSTVFGETKRGCAILRSGAQPGDQIFVTGELGGAAAGLRLLERRKRSMPETEHLLTRQLQPEPRVCWGRFLGENKLATAMIDISDGLSSDLDHLCLASGVGALVDSSRLPIDGAIAAAGFDQRSSLDFALHGGEDFELLFTVSPAKAKRLPEALDGIPINRIGEITKQKGKFFLTSAGRRRKLKPGGYDHFAPTR